MKNTIWLALSLFLGFAIGIGYAWLIRPSEFQGALPDSLRAEYRGEYVLLIASAYRSTADLDRARSRLAAFPGLNAPQLASLAQQVAATGGGEQIARDLALLALALGSQPIAPASPQAVTPFAIATGVIKTPIVDSTMVIPLATLPPSFAQTPFASATTTSRFRLQSQLKVCDEPKSANPQIRVLVQSADGKGVSGVEIIVRWPGGQGHMVTGMKPEVNSGFADYDIVAGVLYELSFGDGALVVGNLAAPGCSAVGSVGSLQLLILT
jgi:hypothetical protein